MTIYFLNCQHTFLDIGSKYSVYITRILFPEVGLDDAEQSTSTQPLAGFDVQLVMRISS
jgi:hypothetical protein